MGDNTGIQWTQRPGTIGATWNATVGCSLESPGCSNCYAMPVAAWLERMWHADHSEPDVAHKRGKYNGLTMQTKNGPVWNGVVRLDESALTLPLRQTKPRTYFVNSMSDLWHPALALRDIAKVYAVMALAKEHTFQVLTKRPERMAKSIADPAFVDMVETLMDELAPEHWCRRELDDVGGWPLNNVWHGTSCEDQARLVERLPWLAQTPSVVRFISFEPLLGLIDYKRAVAATRIDTRAIHWGIIGGESGPRARDCALEWIALLIEDLDFLDTAVFVKQLGARPTFNRQPIQLKDKKGGDMREWLKEFQRREFPDVKVAA